MGWPDNSLANMVRIGLEYAGLSGRLAPFPIRRQASPWTEADIPVDSSLQPGPPDFVGVGTQKSGTSWWCGLIEAHPGVAANRFGRKEMQYLTHFFDRPFGATEIRAYHAAFARSAGKLCGEWTPNYMASPWSLLRLKEAAPQARVLVMLRNPVDRFDSGFNHELKQRYSGVIGPRTRMRVIKEYALRKESLWNGWYASQLEILFSIYPKEQVQVLQYERCAAQPGEMIASTYRFLGLDASFVPQGMDRPVNLQRRITGALGAEGRSLLAQVCRSEVMRLKGLCGESIDLSLWREFATER